MQKILVALLALSLAAGCTTTRTFNSISASSAAQVEPGSTAVIEFTDGSTEQVEIRSYGQTGVEVVSADDTVRSIDYAEIRAVHARQLDGRKTTGAVILGLLAVGLVSALDDVAFFPAGP